MIKVAQREIFVEATDGTLLFVDDRGPTDGHLPVLFCLPGLTRNSRDFEPVFDSLTETRRVIGLDFRGRGRSAHAIDAKSYRPDVELADTLCVMDHLGLSRCAVLGTSRGGIVGMLMAAKAPQRIAGLLLNDVGAVLEPQGLLRIIEHVGMPARFRDWDEAAIGLARNSVGFKNVSHQMWRSAARRIYQYANGGFVHRHDLRLANSLPSIADIEGGKIANLWELLPALANLPSALLRGNGSDLLSKDTVEKMQIKLPTLDCTEIMGRGHVPFLDEPESVTAIARWLAAVDANEKGQPKLTP